MQRKELKKAVKKFSNKTNFYKLGLVRKYIQYQNNQQEKLNKAVPKVNCPCCNSSRISIDYDDRECCNDSWLFCNKCGEIFEDTFGFIDAIGNAEYYCWSDEISVILHFDKPNIKSEKWQKYCENEILETLGLKSPKII